MVKNFEEFINENKFIESSIETPKCLLKIVNFINSKTLKTNISRDGRVSSIKDEDDCINLLRESDDWDVVDGEYENGDKNYSLSPYICLLPYKGAYLIYNISVRKEIGK